MTKKDIPQTGFYFDGEGDKHDYYLDGKRMTGVTTILGVLAKPALIPWAARMACDYVRQNAKITEIAHDQGEQAPAIEVLYEISEEGLQKAQVAHAKKRDEGAEKGSNTHALVEEYINCKINGHKNHTPAESIMPFVRWAERENIRFLASEKQMYSKELFVAGTADFIFEKDGKKYIGDIKTYKAVYDRTPFYQCAGYALMWEEMNPPQHSPNPKVNYIDGYVVFNLPKERPFNEAQDVLWSFDTEGDTKAFLACVEIYRQNAQFKPYNQYKKK